MACDGRAAQLHDVIPAGGAHKFSPDWCVGLLKQRYKKTFFSCLQDIVDVVNSLHAMRLYIGARSTIIPREAPIYRRSI